MTGRSPPPADARTTSARLTVSPAPSPAGSPRQDEEGVRETREPVDLRHQHQQLVAALPRGSRRGPLGPQANSRERRPKLVRGVPGEVRLPLEGVSEPAEDERECALEDGRLGRERFERSRYVVPRMVERTESAGEVLDRPGRGPARPPSDDERNGRGGERRHEERGPEEASERETVLGPAGDLYDEALGHRAARSDPARGERGSEVEDRSLPARGEDERPRTDHAAVGRAELAVEDLAGGRLAVVLVLLQLQAQRPFRGIGRPGELQLVVSPPEEPQDEGRSRREDEGGERRRQERRGDGPPRERVGLHRSSSSSA